MPTHSSSAWRPSAAAGAPPLRSEPDRCAAQRPRSLIGRLRAVFNASLDSPIAPALVAAGGAGVGAGVAVLAGTVVYALPATVIGGALAVVSHQFLLDERRQAHAHAERWEMLVGYPSTRAWIAANGPSFADRIGVAGLHAHAEATVARMISYFSTWCEQHGRWSDPAIAVQIREFCLTHCAAREPLMVMVRPHGRLFLAAVKPGMRAKIARELNSQQPAASVFRKRGDPFICADLVADRSDTDDEDSTDDMPAQACETRAGKRPDGRMPTAAKPLIDCFYATAEPTVALRRRRLARPSALEAPDAPVPPVASKPTRARVVVRQGPVLRRQREALQPDGVALRQIESIKADLAGGRPLGHAIKRLGCQAVDITMPGHTGRNAWRLLYRADAEGVELVGIADYHVAAGSPVRWWDG